MIWISIPLLISLILIELYFGRYSTEELGWNSSLSNSMVLVFVGIDLFRRLLNKNLPHVEFPLTKFIISGAVIIIGLLLLYLSFYHKIPKNLAFALTSVIPVNLTAYLTVVIVYKNIPFDFITIISWIILIAGTWLVFQVIHHFEKKVQETFF